MLAWTSAGAVPRPRTLQLRLHSAWPERVRAGAPVPSRSLSTEEVAANLRWFTAASPRGLPIDALVLSGQGVPARPDLPELVALARSLGVRRVVLHVGVGDLDGLAPIAGVDRYVLPVRLGAGGLDPAVVAAALAGARLAGLPVDANVPLLRATLPFVADAAALARDGGAVSVTFTYPFPTGSPPEEEPPAVPDAVAALIAAVPEVAGPSARGPAVSIKGLPACWLGPLGRFVRKSQNRWYVDADHQREAALLFFPGVVAFAKADACRFCAADGTCDGFLPAWAGRPGNPSLRALE